MHEAIVTGLGYLRLQELPDDERPSKSIWDDGKLMKRWAKEVEEVRKEKYGLKSDRDIRDEPIDGPIEHNSAVRELIG